MSSSSHFFSSPAPAPAPTATTAAAAPVDNHTIETAASADSTNKRARIDPSVAPTSNKHVQSPLQVATTFVESHTESLRAGIATLLLDRAREYLSLAHKLFLKSKNLSRLEKDEDYIPGSARVNFKLQTLKEAEELPEFIELQSTVANHVSDFQATLKKSIIDLLKIEIKVLQDELNRVYCKSIYSTVSLFHVAQRADPNQAHNTALAILETHSEALLKHTTLSSAAFQTLYHQENQINGLAPAPEDTNAQHHAEIKRAIESAFVSSWDRYLEQASENELTISLKKQAKTVLLAKKTEEATMDVDAELPADRQQLQDLIKQQAEAMAKKMIKNEVANQLKAATKNEKRDPSTKGASRTKKPSGKTNNPSSSNRRPPSRQQNEPSRRSQANDHNRSRSRNRRRQNQNRTTSPDAAASASTTANSRNRDRGRRSRSRNPSRRTNNGGNKGRQRS